MGWTIGHTFKCNAILLERTQNMTR